MDDEDLQDLKDSRNLVDTTEEMDFMGGTQAELLVKAEVDDSDREYVSTAIHTSCPKLNEPLPVQYHAH